MATYGFCLGVKISWSELHLLKLKMHNRFMETMTKRIIIKGFSPSWLKNLSMRNRYIVVTREGVEFADRLFQAEKVPSNLCRLYQLLLKLTRMRGTVTVKQVRRLGFSPLTIGRAISKWYVKVHTKPVKPPVEVQKKIEDMKGKAPAAIYA